MEPSKPSQGLGTLDYFLYFQDDLKQWFQFYWRLCDLTEDMIIVKWKGYCK